jgi:hypothetical protein
LLFNAKIIFRSYKNGTGYNRTFYEAIRPLISPGVLFISSTWWGFASPHMIMHKQSRIFFSAIGATFSNIAVCMKLCNFILMNLFYL